MQEQDLRWMLAATGNHRVQLRAASRRAWWKRSLHALRYPVWPMVIMAVLLSGMLLMFQRVVAQGVVQGEQRRSATAAHANGLWRCRSINQIDERSLCLAQMGEH